MDMTHRVCFPEGSFACSTACRTPGKRADLMISSGHDTLLEKDYALLASHHILTARDGARWYLIESHPVEYHWDSFLPQLKVAEKYGIEMVWELAHFGWPDGLDVWQPEFVDRFSAFARALARLMREEGYTCPFITPMNQISFWSWAGAELAWFNPFETGRGRELKRQLARASIAAMHAMREELLDIVGLTWYPDNQWFHNGDPLETHHPGYRPLNVLLQEVWQHDQRPLLIAETRTAAHQIQAWLHLVIQEGELARKAGVPLEGISLYPVVDYPA